MGLVRNRVPLIAARSMGTTPVTTATLLLPHVLSTLCVLARLTPPDHGLAPTVKLRVLRPAQTLGRSTRRTPQSAVTRPAGPPQLPLDPPTAGDPHSYSPGTQRCGVWSSSTARPVQTSHLCSVMLSVKFKTSQSTSHPMSQTPEVTRSTTCQRHRLLPWESARRYKVQPTGVNIDGGRNCGLHTESPA